GFVASAAPTEAIDFSTRWIWSDFGNSGGPEDLLVEDFDQDGRDEILGTGSLPWGGPYGSESWWFLGAFTETYRQVWTSPPMPGLLSHPISSIEDGSRRFVFRTEDAFLVVDAASRETVRTIPEPTSQVRDHAVVDLDGDDEPELVGCSGSTVFVASLKSGSVLRETPAANCFRL